jgi:hypothetical protein
MTPLIRIEILSASYRRAVLRGDRAGAKRIADEMREIRNEIMAKGPSR